MPTTTRDLSEKREQVRRAEAGARAPLPAVTRTPSRSLSLSVERAREAMWPRAWSSPALRRSARTEAGALLRRSTRHYFTFRPHPSPSGAFRILCTCTHVHTSPRRRPPAGHFSRLCSPRRSRAGRARTNTPFAPACTCVVDARHVVGVHHAAARVRRSSSSARCLHSAGSKPAARAAVMRRARGSTASSSSSSSRAALLRVTARGNCIGCRCCC